MRTMEEAIAHVDRVLGGWPTYTAQKRGGHIARIEFISEVKLELNSCAGMTDEQIGTAWEWFYKGWQDATKAASYD